MDNIIYSLIAGGALSVFFGFCGLLGSLVTGSGEAADNPPIENYEIVSVGEVIDGEVISDVAVVAESAYTGSYITFETRQEQDEYRGWLHEQHRRERR